MKEESWFAVRILFESSFPDNSDWEQSFEERIILVKAEDERAAVERAATHAKKDEDEYQNAEGTRVVVSFLEILDYVELFDDEIGDLAEVYYNFLDTNDLGHVRRSLASRKQEVAPALERPKR